MNELEENCKKELDALNGLKAMFYQDKETFKEYLHRQSLTQQAKLMAFLSVNDSKFYKEVNDYTGGIKI